MNSTKIKLNNNVIENFGNSLFEIPTVINDLIGPNLQLLGYYIPENIIGNVWYDISGKNNNATISQIRTLSISEEPPISIVKNEETLNGNTYMYGSTSTKIDWPDGILPNNYTLFHLKLKKQEPYVIYIFLHTKIVK